MLLLQPKSLQISTQLSFVQYEKVSTMDVDIKSFHFDGGDIRAKAILNSEQIDFQVSSHALSFASPVWKEFISLSFPRLCEGPETRGSPSEKKAKRTASFDLDHILNFIVILDFTEDKIDALLILLQIAHLQFANIPKRLPYETLHGVAVLCEQYDCKKLVKPWLADWLKEDWNESNMRGQEGWLFIAWCFGRHGILSELAMTCVLQANIGDGGECMIDGGFHYPRPYCGSTPVDSYPLEKDGILLPLDIVESILDTRQEAIEQIVTAVYGVVEKFEGKKKHDHMQQEPGCSFACDAINLGFLVKALQKEDLWPRPSPGDIRMSIHDLVKILYRIDRFTSRRPAPSGCEWPARDHTNCFPPGHLSSVVTSALSSVPTPVLDSHMSYMDTASLEVGLLD
ncbi:uncharacterized protein PAC_18248 [Phialocephala subalpina]|uniref:BTB domain-containing protein n=1 Tax=Phialocephala subalpina TaxID=576137 RepID=A0A1L7XTJ8_9HELO|nr:uncharacterized protein PAC_18248 [Phialocephala subalpina]